MSLHGSHNHRAADDAILMIHEHTYDYTHLGSSLEDGHPDVRICDNSFERGRRQGELDAFQRMHQDDGPLAGNKPQKQSRDYIDGYTLGTNEGMATGREEKAYELGYNAGLNEGKGIARQREFIEAGQILKGVVERTHVTQDLHTHDDIDAPSRIWHWHKSGKNEHIHP